VKENDSTVCATVAKVWAALLGTNVCKNESHSAGFTQPQAPPF
jgi:hypothetical protein